jgi:hypothetical protein
MLGLLGAVYLLSLTCRMRAAALLGFGWLVASSATSIPDALMSAKKFPVGTSSWVLILGSLGPDVGFDFFACSS